MKNALMWLLSALVAWILFRIVIGAVATLFHFVIWIAMVFLFFWLIGLVYKQLTRQKV